jgi:signal peptidase I
VEPVVWGGAAPDVPREISRHTLLGSRFQRVGSATVIVKLLILAQMGILHCGHYDMLEEKYRSTLTALISEELSSGKVCCFAVSTLSMLPLIRPEDEIVVGKSSGQTLKCGDIIVFERFKELYTHRFLCRRMSGSEMTLVTKGDNSFTADDPISAKDLLGKVTRIRKANRSINLEGRFWKMANSLAGTLSYIEWTLFALLRGFKRSISKLR